MRRVQKGSVYGLPGYDISTLRPQRLEGPPDALSRIRDVFARGDAGGRVRISVYGASHTSNDRFTGRMREVLQKRWGDGGKGHVLPGPLYKWYGGRHISTCWSDGWLSDWQGKANAHRDGLLGHAGMSVSSSHPEEFGWLQTPSRGKTARGVSTFDVYTLGEPGGGTLEVWIDGGERHRIRTDRGSTELIRTRFSVTDGSHRITVSPLGDGEVRIFGISLERQGKGALVDAMGVRGMEARTWLSWEPSLFGPGIRSLAPDLVVLAYGTNEAADQHYSMADYGRDLRQVLGNLKRAAGDDIACILAGPSDRGWDFKDGTFAIWDRTAPVAQVQREVAGEFGCAFWDWQAAMGGPGSMIAWTHRDPALGSKDLIHHSPAGYVFMADRFLAAIDGLR
jgi:lysophospholipase L1-like esterase